MGEGGGGGEGTRPSPTVAPLIRAMTKDRTATGFREKNASPIADPRNAAAGAWAGALVPPTWIDALAAHRSP